VSPVLIADDLNKCVAGGPVGCKDRHGPSMTYLDTP
jgi:hypothetical protein